MYIFLAEKYARSMNKGPASKKVYSVRITLFGGRGGSQQTFQKAKEMNSPQRSSTCLPRKGGCHVPGALDSRGHSSSWPTVTSKVPIFTSQMRFSSLCKYWTLWRIILDVDLKMHGKPRSMGTTRMGSEREGVQGKIWSALQFFTQNGAGNT